MLIPSFAAAGRFSLTVKLLGSSARPTLERLFSGLQSAALAAQAAGQETDKASQSDGEPVAKNPCNPTRVAALQALYGLPPS